MRRQREHSACGVGFVASRRNEPSHEILQTALGALRRVEHRGACAADGVSGDGSGVMTDIPFEVFGYEPGAVAVATLFLTADRDRRLRALDVFTSTFDYLGIRRVSLRDVPVDLGVLGPIALESRPHIVQIFLERPVPVRTDEAFNRLLYAAKQLTRSKLKSAGSWRDLFFTSLSTTTVIYKGLCRSTDLDRLYPDLANPRFKTRFSLFHRRFSTNTRSTWDKAQPFRVIAHNGEINTIAGNRSSCYSREQAMGLARDELLTHDDISDSGNLNEMVEALKYRSSIPHIDEVLSIMIPPADQRSGFYSFWGRALEPWDGPALVAYSNGKTVGARLDRNGFRPARWCMTDDLFCLASEAGVFGLDQTTVIRKGTLRAGSGATVTLEEGDVRFDDPSQMRNNGGAIFDARLIPIAEVPHHVEINHKGAAVPAPELRWLPHRALFVCTKEELDRVLTPMVKDGKEPIGSMGDTARPAIFSELPSSLYDFFYQRFAQVTNPPLDYLRESVVTDLETYLGIRPNVLDPKELIPPAPGIRLERPLLSLAQMQLVESLTTTHARRMRTRAAVIDISFDGSSPVEGLLGALRRIEEDALKQVKSGCSILVLSHRHVGRDRPPIPSLLALRAVVCILNKWGARLRASVVLEAGDIRTTHQVACAIGFGATAICPRLMLELARSLDKLTDLDPDQREERAIKALCQGLLKVMSKMGISVVRSYHSSKLFSAFGLGPRLMGAYFNGVSSPVGGLELPQLAKDVCKAHAWALEHDLDQPLPSLYRLKEKVKGDAGEKHSMTAARSKLIHDLVRGRLQGRTTEDIYARYEAMGEEAAPTSPRHLLDLRPADQGVPLDEVEPASAILRRFGSGAMSFGAISAESQRDIFVAMRKIGGRCNSGEGGENPYYYLDGTSATTKQVASGRFGVTAEYLIAGDEIEIKVAQGAKPGEGGQLMGVKVDEHIARARHATPGVDLISPPPLHDIYSIEDLKELIYELKQLAPGHGICVKLVAGDGIGTIAVGVAKAGADVVQISGGDGGTGAAPLSSMRHAGLPWELGLVDAHQSLVENGMRDRVRLRIDGGLSTPKDVLIAALLGADEYGFGKLLLVAEGCIMARVCEKNRCPTGIATHDPKFKAKYKGTPEHVESLLRRFADDLRVLLSALGVRSMDEAIGQRRHLRAAARFAGLVDERGIDLGPLLAPVPYVSEGFRPTQIDRSPLNRRLIEEILPAIEAGDPIGRTYRVSNVDRAVLAGLAGVLAARSRDRRHAALDGETPNFSSYAPPPGSARLEFDGSAGQGFAAFLVGGIEVLLRGEANDAVCKSMSGGEVVIVPPAGSPFRASENVIMGNCALYGATGGRLFVSGRAGDRFAVRNSGAQAVVEGTGLHCCEYMTGGTIVVLGPVSHNAGAGMTGGVLYLRRDEQHRLNRDYVRPVELSGEDEVTIRRLLQAHVGATKSETARRLLDDPGRIATELCRVEPDR